MQKTKRTSINPKPKAEMGGLGGGGAIRQATSATTNLPAPTKTKQGGGLDKAGLS